MELEVRGHQVPVSESIKQLVERRFDFALDRFSAEIQRVGVVLTDIHHSRGVSDKQCRVNLILNHGGSIQAEGTDEHLRDAIDRAARRASRRLTRRVDRRTIKRHRAQLSRALRSRD